MKKKEKEILSVSERNELKGDIKDMESMLRETETEGFGAGTRGEALDKVAIKRKIAHLERALQESGPTRLTGATKDKMAKRARELEEHISQGMCTYDEMNRPKEHPGCIMKHVMWEKRNKPHIQEWKRIQRQLNPSDPSASSIERFRRR